MVLVAPTYEVKVQSAVLNDNAPEVTVTANNLQYTYLLNRPGSCTFEMPLLDPGSAEIDPGRSFVRVYRNGTLVWGGKIWSGTASWQTAGGNLTVHAEGWYSILQRRLITDYPTGSGTATITGYSCTNKEQFDIAWELIQLSHNMRFGPIDTTDPTGQLNWTRGLEIASGITYSKSWTRQQYKNIAEAIEEMAEANEGFDFEVSPDRVWHVWHPHRGTKLEGSGAPYIKFGDPNIDPTANAIGASLTIDASDMATYVGLIGSGWTTPGSDAGQITAHVSSTAQAGYKQNSLGETRQRYGLDMISGSYIEITDPLELTQKAVEILHSRDIPRFQPQISLVPTDANPIAFGYETSGKAFLGDEIRVTTDFEGFAAIDDFFRIIAIEVQRANSGREAVTVQFDEPRVEATESWARWRGKNVS